MEGCFVQELRQAFRCLGPCQARVVLTEAQQEFRGRARPLGLGLHERIDRCCDWVGLAGELSPVRGGLSGQDRADGVAEGSE